MVDGGSLENCWAATSRGFESLRLRFMIRKLIGIVSALLAFASLAGAQQMGERFVFTPQSTAQAQFAGYYVALEQGFYADEGLDVVIAHPYPTASAVDNIRTGVCQATILPLSLAMRTIDGGLPLVGGDIFFEPVFNFADSCVTVGAIYLILFQWKFFSKEE